MASELPLTVRLAETARRHPTQVAVRDTIGTTSYGELWQQVEAVARQLRKCGLQTGERVAIALENSAWWPAACYGAWRAGAIVVPLNMAASTSDLQMWLSNSAASLVISQTTDSRIRAAVAMCKMPPRQVFIDDIEDQQRCSTDELLTDSGATLSTDQPAMIAYTSGTTGSPKGVLLSHGNLAANTAAIISYLELSGRDSTLTMLPFYYAYGSSVLHTHLATGATLVLEHSLAYPQRICQRLIDEQITGLPGVASTFSLLLARSGLDTFRGSALRYLTQAGGPMSPGLTQRLRAALPQARLFRMYGQTEATARLTYLPPEQLDTRPASVGRPVADTRIEIRGEDGRPARPGESGDIWAQGPGIMLGYWDNPAASAEVLVNGWLRTGDSGHLDEAGFLFLDGRRGDMIKTGAHRVHPVAIEEVIGEIPGIADAVAVGVDDRILGQVIRVCIVPEAGVTLDARIIQAHCRSRLASYQVPKFVEFVTSLPRSSTGKIQRWRITEGEARSEC